MYMYYLLGYKLVGNGTISSRDSSYTTDTNKTKGSTSFQSNFLIKR